MGFGGRTPCRATTTPNPTLSYLDNRYSGYDGQSGRVFTLEPSRCRSLSAGGCQGHGSVPNRRHSFDDSHLWTPLPPLFFGPLTNSVLTPG